MLQAVVIVALVAGFLAHRNQSTTYQAQAQLYVEPSVNPDGTLPLPTQTATFNNNAAALPGVLGSSLAREVTSADVLKRAATALGADKSALGATLSTSVNAADRTITLTATANDPAQATKLVNAVAQALVDSRWAARQSALEAQITATNSQLAANAATPAGPLQTQLQSAYLANLVALQAAVQTKDNGVQFLLPAEGAVKVESTDPLTRALQGAAIGLVLGLGLAALREAMDSKVRDRELAEEITGLRTLGELPKTRKLRKQRLGVVDAPWSHYAEGVRALRGSLMWAVEEGAPASIAVTSPQPGDGKTTVAVNLAAAFALAGVKTVLVSADFRKPATDLGLLQGTEWETSRFDTGLAELLLAPRLEPSDEVAVEAALVGTRIEHLRWLPAAGSTPPEVLSTSASELLSSARARKLLIALSGTAELIVIDTPPALLSDAASINGIVDGVLLVVNVGGTRRSGLRRTIRMWKGSPVTPLGLVLNCTRPVRDDTLASNSGGYRRTRKQAQRAIGWNGEPAAIPGAGENTSPPIDVEGDDSQPGSPPEPQALAD